MCVLFELSLRVPLATRNAYRRGGAKLSKKSTQMKQIFEYSCQASGINTERAQIALRSVAESMPISKAGPEGWGGRGGRAGVRRVAPCRCRPLCGPHVHPGGGNSSLVVKLVQDDYHTRRSVLASSVAPAHS